MKSSPFTLLTERAAHSYSRRVTAGTRRRYDRPVVAGQADRFGIAASSLCAVHCGLGAVLVGVTATGGFLFEEPVELALVGVAVVLAILAVAAGWRRHRRAAPLWIAGAGILVLAVARLGVEGGSAEVALSVAGAAVLVSAHVVNLRLLARAAACSARDPVEG
jgi:hypothetical protein